MNLSRQIEAISVHSLSNEITGFNSASKMLHLRNNIVYKRMNHMVKSMVEGAYDARSKGTDFWT